MLPDTVTEKTIHVKEGEFAQLMRSAFDQVCDPADWKAPIDCIVPVGAEQLYTQAIVFMTATYPNQNRCSDATGNPSWRLTSIGYRAGPAGP